MISRRTLLSALPLLAIVPATTHCTTYKPPLAALDDLFETIWLNEGTTLNGYFPHGGWLVNENPAQIITNNRSRMSFPVPAFESTDHNPLHESLFGLFGIAHHFTPSSPSVRPDQVVDRLQESLKGDLAGIIRINGGMLVPSSVPVYDHSGKPDKCRHIGSDLVGCTKNCGVWVRYRDSNRVGLYLQRGNIAFASVA